MNNDFRETLNSILTVDENKKGLDLRDLSVLSIGVSVYEPKELSL